MGRGENLLETIPKIHSSLDNNPFGYAVVGGLATDALLDEKTKIDYTNRRILFSDESVVSPCRPNGTPKDIDILAFTTDYDAIQDSRSELVGLLSSKYPLTSISLSGYDTAHNDRSLQVVTRTVAQQGSTLCLSMGIVRQEISSSHLEETWTAEYRDNELSVLHPVAHLASYKTRSITGIRPKDVTKVKALEERLIREVPSSEWQEFKPWDEFAAAVQETYSLKKMFERPNLHYLVMTMGKIGLGAMERSPWLVALTQDDTTRVASFARSVMKRSKPSYQP